VNERPIKDLPASVHRRLLDRSKEQGLAFQGLCQRFAMERFLYRLAASPHADQFILKGAPMLFVWQSEPLRQTMDIDLLGRGPSDPNLIRTVFQAICTQDVPADGMEFDEDSVEVERIAREAIYEGVRVKLRGSLGSTRVLIRVDIGFGDRVVPAAEFLDYPTLLDFPAPRLRAYRRETTIAEKFHAMVQLGDLNSRMKDFLDIWSLSGCFDFEGQVLAEAIEATFDGRSPRVPSEPLALTAEFARTPLKQEQWSSFLRRRQLQAPADFAEVVEQIASFLQPVAGALSAGLPFEAHWEAPGPWRPQ
jgi:hypothetical protein